MDLAQLCVRHISTLSMNQALEELSCLEEYLTCSFIHHCTHTSTESTDLKNDLMQLCDLRPRLESVSDGNLLELPSFFFLHGCIRSVLFSLITLFQD